MKPSSSGHRTNLPRFYTARTAAMPKRTLSSSSLPAYPDSSDGPTSKDVLQVHVAKFSRVSASPSPSVASTPDMNSDAQQPGLPGDTGDSKSIQCQLPPHAPLTFSSVAQFEAHWYSHHTNRCVECKRNFPSSHLLELHQAEQHDPLVAARREKGEKTFACLVPGCEKVCVDRWKRRRHLIDKHGYRNDYDWAVVERGIDGKRSALQGARGRTQRGRKASLTGDVGERGVRMTAGFQRPVEVVENEDSMQSTKGEGSSEAPKDDEDEDISSLDEEAERETAQPQSSKEPMAPKTKASAKGDELDSLTKSMLSLRFVPPSVRRKKIATIENSR